MPGPMRPARLLALALLLATAPALGACDEPAPQSLRGRVLRIRMEEYRLVPQVVHARAGRLTIRARNAGLLAHNVKVERGDAQTPSENPDAPPPEPIGGTETVQHGEVSTGTLRLRPGTYRLVCTVANHDNLGMYGTLVVR
jgi:plastocyanin